jgi:hypothetical protein
MLSLKSFQRYYYEGMRSFRNFRGIGLYSLHTDSFPVTTYLYINTAMQTLSEAEGVSVQILLDINHSILGK